MKFMLLIYGSHGAWRGITADGEAKLTSAHVALQEELKAAGEFIECSELNVPGAKVVRSRASSLTVSDGPFSEGQEILAGYYIVDCSTMERAVEIAGRLGETAFAPIDVRQIGPSGIVVGDAALYRKKYGPRKVRNWRTSRPAGVMRAIA